MKELFNVIRDIKKAALTQEEVDRVNTALKGVEPGIGTLRLFSEVAASNVNPDILRAMAAAFNQYAVAYKMTTKERIAEFIAQIANETGGFKTFVENMNYSAKRLMEVWPGRYPTLKAAMPYANNPQGLANHTYADRMGNGAAASGDGWRFRGRGALQLTGRNAYAAADERLKLGLLSNPDLAADPATSVLIALDFWKENAVNTAVDAGDYRKARKITNGGAIGLEEVARLRNKLLKVMP